MCRTGPYETVRTRVRIRKPPTSNDQPASSENNSFVRPEIVVVVIVYIKMLHHGDPVPTRDIVLRSQRVHPARHVEMVTTIGIDALAGKADRGQHFGAAVLSIWQLA